MRQRRERLAGCWEKWPPSPSIPDPYYRNPLARKTVLGTRGRTRRCALFRPGRQIPRMAHARGAALPDSPTGDARACRPALSLRASCDGRRRDRHHARRHGRGVAASLSRRARCRVSGRLRVLRRRIRASSDGCTGRPGCRTSPEVARAARLGHFARRRIRLPRRAPRSARRRRRSALCEPLRLYLGLQARALFAGLGEPAASDQQCPARAALGPARLRHSAAARREPRLSAGTPIPARALWLDPGGPVVGDRDDDDDRLWRRDPANAARPHPGRGRHGQRNSGLCAVGRHSRLGLCRGAAAARVSANLGSGRQGSVLPRCRRLGHCRRGAPAAPAGLPGRGGHRAARRARGLHVFCRRGGLYFADGSNNLA